MELLLTCFLAGTEPVRRGVKSTPAAEELSAANILNPLSSTRQLRSSTKTVIAPATPSRDRTTFVWTSPAKATQYGGYLVDMHKDRESKFDPKFKRLPALKLVPEDLSTGDEDVAPARSARGSASKGQKNTQSVPQKTAQTPRSRSRKAGKKSKSPPKSMPKPPTPDSEAVPNADQGGPDSDDGAGSDDVYYDALSYSAAGYGR